jgi:hypothetical protein
MGIAKLVARLLATAALWVRMQTSLKNTNGRHKQRSGQHSSPPKKYPIKSFYQGPEIDVAFCIDTAMFPNNEVEYLKFLLLKP